MTEQFITLPPEAEGNAESYYGTKLVVAWPQEKDGAAGYGILYKDGYVSWSPIDAFNAAYQHIDALSFGHALAALNSGCRVARAGWNGKGMFIVYMPPLSLPPYSTQGTERKVNDRTAKWIGEDTPFDSLGYFAMWTADQKWQPGWLPSQADMLANDWTVLPA